MTNGFYDPTDITAHTKARSAEVNAQLAGIGAGFDKFPTESNIKLGKIQFVAADTGVPNAYVVAMPYTRTTLTDGEFIRMRAANTNTGASTINRDGAGVVPIRNYAGTALTGGEIVADGFTDLVYDATFGYFRISNPQTTVASIIVNNLLKVSATDTTPGYGGAKISVTASGAATVTPSTTNPGGNEVKVYAIAVGELGLTDAGLQSASFAASVGNAYTAPTGGTVTLAAPTGSRRKIAISLYGTGVTVLSGIISAGGAILSSLTVTGDQTLVLTDADVTRGYV